MKRTTWIGAVLGVAATIALVAWAFAPRPVEVEVATVTRDLFETGIEEDGKTRLRDRYVISAPLSGLLARITLREGDRVEADAVVATIMPPLATMIDERTRREQQARVEMTQAQVQRAVARIERAKVALEQASSDVRRTEQLAREGFVSPNRLETERLAALAARKELDAAVEERHVAEHEAEQARAALVAVRTPERSGPRTLAVRSPVAGRVLRVMQPSENAVTLGTPLIEVGDIDRLEVVAELLTTDALQARPGSRVVIDRWGGAGPLEGRVRLVEPSAFTKVSALGVEEQRVNVIIDITSPPEHWRALGDGFRVGVRIITRSVHDAVVVPVSAVFPLPEGADGGGGMGVFTILAGRAKLVPVHVEARNAERAWVARGLAPGTAVIVYPPTTVKDGTAVRARKV